MDQRIYRENVTLIFATLKIMTYIDLSRNLTIMGHERNNMALIKNLPPRFNAMPTIEVNEGRVPRQPYRVIATGAKPVVKRGRKRTWRHF